MDCREIEFQPLKSCERIKRAERLFDPKVLQRIQTFALYLFGVKRRVVAELVGMPEESVKTNIRVLFRDGFQAFLDRRQSETHPVPKVSLSPGLICVYRDSDWIVIDFNSNVANLRIPATHKVQVRTVLLSLLNSGLLSTKETASALEITQSHCRELAGKLAGDNVGDSLVDKRKGQLQDFRVGPAQKAEIIQQFAARAVTGLSTSSDVLTELVNEKTHANLSPRTVRWHMNKFNLSIIKKTLPELVGTLKKNS